MVAPTPGPLVGRVSVNVASIVGESCEVTDSCVPSLGAGIGAAAQALMVLAVAVTMLALSLDGYAVPSSAGLCIPSRNVPDSEPLWPVTLAELPGVAQRTPAPDDRA